MGWPWAGRMGLPGMRRLGMSLLAALPLMLAAPVTAHAQMESREGIALQNQLYQLRQEIQMLRGEVGRGGGGGGGDIAAQLLSRVQSMEEQVRQLRGRIDETRNLHERHHADLLKRIEDLTFQIGLQSRGTASSSALIPPPAAPPAAPPVRESVAPRPVPDPARPLAEGVPRPDILQGGPDISQVRPEPPLRPEPAVRPEPAPRPEPPPRIVMPVPPVLVPPPPRQPQSFTFNQAPEPMREVQPPFPPPRIDPPPPVIPAGPPSAARVEPPPVVRPDPPRPPPRPAPPPRETASAPPPPADVTATAIAPGGKRTPEMALQEGHAALARRDYTAAERAAREVMANRASPRAYDGQLLLAQSLSGQKQFAQSAIAFDDAYNRSHKGRHAQDALLGLAGALTAINERKAACDTLSRLRTEFPQVRADLRDSITRTNERAGCGR